MERFEMTRVTNAAGVITEAGILLLVLAIAFFVGAMFISSRKCSLLIGNDKLEIKTMFYGTELDFSEIELDKIRTADMKSEKIRMTARTNGIGLPDAKIGWFISADGGKYKLYVTDESEVVLIPVKKGYTILFSSREAEKIVESLKRIN